MSVRALPAGDRRFGPLVLRSPAAACLAALICVLSAGSGAAGQALDDSSGLASLREMYISAYNRGDAGAMRSLYVVDAVRMPYDAPAQEGRGSILASYRKAFASRRLLPTLSLNVDELLVRGDVAVERGHYREEFRSLSREIMHVERGKYMAVARKGADGGWRYEASIFNRDSAPTSTPSAATPPSTPPKPSGR